MTTPKTKPGTKGGRDAKAAGGGKAAAGRKAAPAKRKKGGGGLPVFPLALSAMIVLGLIAIVLSRGDRQPAEMPSVAEPTVTGQPLPPLPQEGGDPAVGGPFPEVVGQGFAGETVRIAADGRPKMILFLAHWCPACMAEVPVVQEWVNEGGIPAEVDLISITTSNTPGRPNYPPNAWLERERWTSPVLVDSNQNLVSASYGMTGTPFWVFIDANGVVVGRVAGQLPRGALEAVVAELAQSARG